MPDQLPGPIIKQRTKQMIGMGEKLGLAYYRTFIGRQMNVLWEQVTGASDQGLRWIGYTDNYIRVSGYGGPDLHNQVVPLWLTDAASDGMRGTFHDPHRPQSDNGVPS